jgi:hypothetical protein
MFLSALASGKLTVSFLHSTVKLHSGIIPELFQLAFWNYSLFPISPLQSLSFSWKTEPTL